MLRLSKRLLMAIEAVLDVAYNAGGRPVQAHEISARQGIPRRYLEQSLQALVRANVLTGRRGPRGGYRLARERRKIALGEIYRVIRKIETAPDPISDSPASPLGHNVVRPLWLEMYGEMVERLDRITLEELCERADKAGLKPESGKAERAAGDFAI